MKSYTDTQRGTYQFEEYGKRLISFEGMNFRGSTGKVNVTPTDIDGFIQFDIGNIFIFVEFKYGAPRVPDGQARALNALVDAINGHAIWVIATHHNSDFTQPVIAAEAVVHRYYSNSFDEKGWNVLANKMKLKQFIDFYLNKLNEKGVDA